MKKTSIIIVILLTAISISYGAVKERFGSTKRESQPQLETIISEEKRLLNSLPELAGSLVKVSWGKTDLLFSTSIVPMLASGSPAREETMSVHKDWLPGPCSQAPHSLVGSRYFVHLDRMPNSALISLKTFDIGRRLILNPIVLTSDSSTNDSNDSLSDSIVDFTVNNNTIEVSYIVRRGVWFDSPDPGGVVGEDSRAELWRVRVPEGNPERIAIFKPERLKVEDSPYTFDLPIRAFDFGDDYLIQWQQHVELVSKSTLKRTLLYEGPGVFEVSIAPAGGEAVLAVKHYDQDDSTMQLFRISSEDQKLTEVVAAPIGYEKILWHPSRALVVTTTDRLGELVQIDLDSHDVKKFMVDRNRSVSLYNWVPDGRLLIGRIPSSDEPRDESPETDFNYKTIVGIWDPTTRVFEQLRNFRTPLFLGVLSD